MSRWQGQTTRANRREERPCGVLLAYHNVVEGGVLVKALDVDGALVEHLLLRDGPRGRPAQLGAVVAGEKGR